MKKCHDVVYDNIWGLNLSPFLKHPFWTIPYCKSVATSIFMIQVVQVLQYSLILWTFLSQRICSQVSYCEKINPFPHENKFIRVFYLLIIFLLYKTNFLLILFSLISVYFYFIPFIYKFFFACFYCISLIFPQKREKNSFFKP